MNTQSRTEAAKPSHRIYLVVGDGKEATWTPIGAAWPNRNGAGFSIKCDVLAADGGRVIMRAITERTAGGQQ